MACPTPRKVAYETRVQADKAVAASWAAGVCVRSYPCPCGAYHLTKRNVAVRVCGYGPCDRLVSPIDGARYCCRTHARKAKEKRRKARLKEEDRRALERARSTSDTSLTADQS